MHRARTLAHAVVAAASLSLGLAACEPQTPAKAATAQYTDDARRLYERAMTAFRDHDWEEARLLFQELRKKYSYSRYARLAELRIADADFESEKVPESVTAYRAFINDHRTDEEVPYARYRICRALFLQINDTILLPPAEERDQAGTFEAYKELRSFLHDYPRASQLPEAAWMLAVVTSRLVRHELYVARFYLRLDDFDAAVARIRYALRKYDGSGMESEALVLLGETYLKMHKPDEARQAFQNAITKYPAAAFTPTAQRFLAEMDARR